MQLFRVVCLSVPVLLLLHVCRPVRGREIFILFGLLLLFAGTEQKQIVKNAMFSLPMLSLLVFVWFKAREGRGRLLFLFPFVLLFWSHLHGSVLVGLAFVVLALSGSMMDWALFERNNLKGSRLLLPIVVILLSFWAVWPNWQGEMKVAWFGINSSVERLVSGREASMHSEGGVFGGTSSDADFVKEYASPLVHPERLSVLALFVLTGLCLVATIVCLVGRSFRFAFVLPVIGFLYLGYGYTRTLPHAFPVLLPLMLPVLIPPLGDGRLKRVAEALLFVFVFFVSVYLHRFVFYGNYSGRLPTTSLSKPSLGLSPMFREEIPKMLLSLPEDTKIYNSYNSGSWLLWNWYGKRKVTVDGRSLMYKREFFNRVLRYDLIPELDRSGIGHAVFSTKDDGTRVANFLLLDWVPVCWDSSLVYLKRVIPRETVLPQYLQKVEEYAELPRDLRLHVAVLNNLFFRNLLRTGRLRTASELQASSAPYVEHWPQEALKERESLERTFQSLLDQIGAVDLEQPSDELDRLFTNSTRAERRLSFADKLLKEYNRPDDALLEARIALRENPSLEEAKNMIRQAEQAVQGADRNGGVQ